MASFQSLLPPFPPSVPYTVPLISLYLLECFLSLFPHPRYAPSRSPGEPPPPPPPPHFPTSLSLRTTRIVSYVVYLLLPASHTVCLGCKATSFLSLGIVLGLVDGVRLVERSDLIPSRRRSFRFGWSDQLLHTIRLCGKDCFFFRGG